jgi:hypothetical protein
LALYRAHFVLNLNSRLKFTTISPCIYIQSSTIALKTQILRKYLSGLSQEQIAIEFDISEGTVSAFLQELRQLDDTLTLQHEIAVFCHKYNIPIQELPSNLAFSNALKRMAFENNKIDLLLRILNKIIVEDGIFSPEKIATLILQICNFMQANGLSLEETHRITEEKSKQLSEIKKKIIESKKIIVKTEQANNQKKELLEKSKIKIEAMIMKNKVKEEQINLLVRLREIFSVYELDFDEIEIFNLARIIKNFKDLKWDVNSIKSEYQKQVSLKSTNEDLEKKIDKKQIMLQKYSDTEKELETRLNAEYNAFKIFSSLIQTGLKREDIFNISLILKNDFSNNSVSQLIEDIRTYGSLALAKLKLEREYNNEIES